MITLLPSKRVEKLTGIDYNVLGWAIDKVLSANFKKDFVYNVTIHKSRVEGTSFVCLGGR